MSQVVLFKDLVLNGGSGCIRLGACKSELDSIFGVSDIDEEHREVEYCDRRLRFTLDQDDRVSVIKVYTYSHDDQVLATVFPDIHDFYDRNEIGYIDLWSMHKVPFIIMNAHFWGEKKGTVQMTSGNNVTVVLGYEYNIVRGNPLLSQIIIDNGGMWDYSVKQRLKKRAW